MTRIHLGLLTFGVFLIIVAVWIAASVLAIITTKNLVPLILLSSGVWTVVVAGIKTVIPEENNGAFSTFGWGMLFIVLGGSWYLNNVGMPIEFTVVFVLLLLGALAVVTALRVSKK
ncbi:MAG: hypothetical protein ACE5KD_03705 [Candidatus Bathyarchaeia archaeon]